MTEKEKKLLPKRPCKTCKNPDCSSAGDAYGQEFICTSFVSSEDLKQKEKVDEFAKKLAEDLTKSWGNFPFL